MHGPFSLRWLLVGAGALMAAANGLVVGALGPALPALHTALRTPLDRLGVLFAASFLGGLVATLGIGPLLDRRQPRPLLLLGCGLVAGGLALLPQATTLPQAVIAVLLMGLGSGTCTIGGIVLATRLFEGQGGRPLSLINMSFGLGAFAGPLLMAASLDTFHDYRPVFRTFAALVAVPALVYLRASLPGPQRPEHSLGGRLARADLPPILLLAAVTFLYLGVEIGFGGWIYTYVRQTTRATVGTASWAPAAYWLALSLSSLGAALRPRSIPAEWLVLWCSAGASLGLAGTLVAQGSVALEIAAACLAGLFLGPIYPLSVASSATLVPAASGRVVALVMACSQIGGALLPWLQGLVLVRGPGWGVATALLCCLSMTGLQLGFLRQQRWLSAARGRRHA